MSFSKNLLVPVLSLLVLSACSASQETAVEVETPTEEVVEVFENLGLPPGVAATEAVHDEAIGGAAGEAISVDMDRQAKELRNTIPDARIARVAEGIIMTFDSSKLFGFNSSELQDAAKESLYHLSNNLIRNSDQHLMVFGHTDDVGQESYNQRLSVKRAKAATDYLIDEGVRKSRITVIGKGELDPIASNEDEEGQEMNRRIEIVVYASANMKARYENLNGQ